MKMKKGSYTIQESVEFKGHAKTWNAPAPQPADSSFSACLLTLLFFLGLCIVVLLAAWPWGDDVPHTSVTDEDKPIHEGLAGGEGVPTTPHTDWSTDWSTDYPSTTTEEFPIFVEPDDGEAGTAHPEDYDDSTHHTTTDHTIIHHEITKPSKGGSSKGGSSKGGSSKGGSSKGGTKGGGKHSTDSEWIDGDERIETLDEEVRRKERLRSHDGSSRTTGSLTKDDSDKSTTNTSPSLTTKSKTDATDSKSEPTTTTLEPTDTLGFDRAAIDTPETDSSPVKAGGDLSERMLSSEALSTCTSPICKSLSARMLAYMNHSASPCKNFYDYACGGMRSINSYWINEVHRDSDSWTRLSDMVRRVDASSPISHQKFKSFYHSCLYFDDHFNRNERIEKVRKVVNDVGKFYSSDEWTEGAGVLTDVIGKLLKYHFTPLLDIILDVDSHKNTKFALKLTAPVFKSPFGYLRDNEASNLRGWPQQSCVHAAMMKPESPDSELNFNQRYEDYIKCSGDYGEYAHQSKIAIQEVGVIQFPNKTREERLISESVIYMDILLGKISSNMISKEGEKRKTLISKEYTEYTIKELKEKFPLIDWMKLIEMLLEVKISEDTPVQVYFESYFKSLFDELTKSSIDERRLVNALMVMFTHELYYGLVMNQQNCNRANYCLKVSQKLMDDVSSALFLKSLGSEKLNKLPILVNQIFLELILSLKSEISKMSWMDAESQNAALDKAQQMKLYADGGVSVFLNDTLLDSQLHEYPMNSGYLENAILLLQRYRKRMYSAYKKNPSDPEQIWSHFLLPFDTQGKVIYGLNAIAIPFGLLSKPFFNENYPSYVQMANLGHIMAHEIWHHFDRAGIMYDAKGSKKNLFSKSSEKNMELLSECMAKQYNIEYKGSEDGLKYTYKLDSNVSLNERLADLGGTHLAYSSLWSFTGMPLKDGPLPYSSMTPQQLFFLSMAQNFCSKSSVSEYILSIFENEHLPPFRRINDIAFNSPQFRKAFLCEDKAPCEYFT